MSSAACFTQAATRQVPSDQNGHGAGDSEAGYEQADALSRYIGQTPHLAQLVERPLHLAMLTLAYEQACDQPSGLMELYGQACEILWRETPSHAPPTDPSALGQSRTPRSHLPLSLAFQAMRAGRPAAPAAGRETMPAATALVVERTAGTYVFAHQSIQHFLAATYLRTQADDSEVFALPDSPPWKEVLRFYCSEVEGRRILRTCLSRDQPSPGVIQLAAMYLQETGDDDEVRNELEELLNESARDPDPLLKQAAESALFDLRLGRGGDSGEGLSDPVTIAEYQVFLDSSPMAGAKHRPDHWTGGHTPQQEHPTATIAGRACGRRGRFLPMAHRQAAERMDLSIASFGRGVGRERRPRPDPRDGLLGRLRQPRHLHGERRTTASHDLLHRAALS